MTQAHIKKLSGMVHGLSDPERQSRTLETANPPAATSIFG
jgi:hypothetical protein